MPLQLGAVPGPTAQARASDPKVEATFGSDAPSLKQRIVHAENRVHFPHDALERVVIWRDPGFRLGSDVIHSVLSWREKGGSHDTPVRARPPGTRAGSL
jgi:hypothetical protein